MGINYEDLSHEELLERIYLLEEQLAASGIDSHGRQGAGSVSNAPAGQDKTAAPLFKSAAPNPLNYLKNITGSNVRKAQKNLDISKNVAGKMTDSSTKIKKLTEPYEKDLINARAGRNKARLGTGAAIVGGGGLYGGYQALKSPVDDQQAAYLTDPSLSSEQKMAFDSMFNRFMDKQAGSFFNQNLYDEGDLMYRFEKTAGPKDWAASQYGRAKDLGSRAWDATSNAGRSALESAQLYGDNLTGKTYREAKQMAANFPEYAGEAGDALVRGTRNNMLATQGITAGAVGGAGGLGYMAARGDDEEQLAYEDLMYRLDKTAGVKDWAKGAWGKTKETGSKAWEGTKNQSSKAWEGTKDYGKTVSGQNYRTAKGLGEKNLMSDASIKRRRNEMLKAQGITAGALAAGGGLGYGAHALSNRNNDEEQLAYAQHMDYLDKVAGPRDWASNQYNRARDLGSRALDATSDYAQRAGEGVWDYGNTVSGSKYRQAKRLGEAGSLTDDEVRAYRNSMLKAQGLTAGAAGAAGGLGYGAYALANRGGDEEEQLAYAQHMDYLDKVAGPRDWAANQYGRAKDLGSRALDATSDYAKTVSGGHYRDAKRVNEEGLGLMSDEAVRNYRNQMLKAQGITAGAVGAAGGLGYGAHALANRGGGEEEQLASADLRNRLEKAASFSGLKKKLDFKTEDGRNSLYKEAATAIVNESLPPVRKHVDPMSKITFSK